MPDSKKKTPERNEKGQFVRGRAKTGGRAAGTKNKYGNIRDRLKNIIMPYLTLDPDEDGIGGKTLIRDLASIDDPNDRAHVIAAYMPYVVPKYTATTITADMDRPVDEEQQLIELDQRYTKKETTLTLKQVTIVNNDAPLSAQQPPALADFDPDEDDDFDLNSLK